MDLHEENAEEIGRPIFEDILWQLYLTQVEDGVEVESVWFG